MDFGHWTFGSSFYRQSIVSPLNSSRQFRRVSRMLNIVCDVREKSAPWFYPRHVFQRLINPKMRGVFFETQAIEHQHVGKSRISSIVPRNLASVGCIAKSFRPITITGSRP